MFRCTVLMTCGRCFQVYGFNDVSTLEETVIMEVQLPIGVFSVTIKIQVNVDERALFVVRLEGTSECYTYIPCLMRIDGNILVETRMHSSRMRTARSLPYGGVSVQGCLCPGGGGSVRGALCSEGVCPGGGLPDRDLIIGR